MLFYVLASGKTEEDVTSFCEQTITGSCDVTDIDVDLSAAVNKCVIDVKVTVRLVTTPKARKKRNPLNWKEKQNYYIFAGSGASSVITSQETDSYDWAVDKLAEVEFNCVEAIVQSVNLTESTGNDTSSTAERVALVTSQVAQATASVCPLQCSMQGQCNNGTCDCDAGTDMKF